MKYYLSSDCEKDNQKSSDVNPISNVRESFGSPILLVVKRKIRRKTRLNGENLTIRVNMKFIEFVAEHRLAWAPTKHTSYIHNEQKERIQMS
jgi:hypothetical protein